jgi:hypothetical protein
MDSNIAREARSAFTAAGKVADELLPLALLETSPDPDLVARRREGEAFATHGTPGAHGAARVLHPLGPAEPVQFGMISARGALYPRPVQAAIGMGQIDSGHHEPQLQQTNNLGRDYPRSV